MSDNNQDCGGNRSPGPPAPGHQTRQPPVPRPLDLSRQTVEDWLREIAEGTGGDQARGNVRAGEPLNASIVEIIQGIRNDLESLVSHAGINPRATISLMTKFPPDLIRGCRTLKTYLEHPQVRRDKNSLYKKSYEKVIFFIKAFFFHKRHFEKKPFDKKK